MKKENLLFIFLALAAMAAVMLILPIDDDWFFLRYFPQASDWGLTRYHWLNDNFLLRRDYWRPIEDIIMHFETSHPWLFPYLQHFLIVTAAFGSAWMACKLGIKLGAAPRRMTLCMCICIFMANNLGALTSIDSLTQVFSAFFGLLSILFLSSHIRGRLILWIVCGAIACISKESGCVFFACGPLYQYILRAKERGESIFRFQNVRSFIPVTLAAILLTLLYIGVYHAMGQMNPYNGIPSHTVLTPASTSTDITSEFFHSQISHELTLNTFIKNLAILYGLGIYPVAVSGFYYGNFTVIMISLLTGWAGTVLLIRMWKASSGAKRNIFTGIIILAAVISLPALVTRAGEISPFNSNMILISGFGLLASGYRFRKTDYILLCLFIATTLFTDGYKYSLAYRGGVKGREMAREIVRLSPGTPDKVLWVGVDEYRRDKAGAAFNMSPYKAFSGGSAVIREYGYRHPRMLYRYKVPDTAGAAAKIDSIATANLSRYDCIWITKGDTVQVRRRQ